MASKKEIQCFYDQAIEISKKIDVIWIEDIIGLLPISKPTFYSYWPIDSNEFNALKKNLDINRISKKIEIRKKLGEGRGTELLALYKLLATEEELKILSTNYFDHTSKGKEMQGLTLKWGDNEIKV